MIARRNPKKTLGSSLHVPVTFFLRFDLRSIVLDPEVIKEKIIGFRGDGFSFITFFDNRDTKMSLVPSCSACRDGSENVSFDIEKSISKFDLGSGQVKVRS